MDENIKIAEKIEALGRFGAKVVDKLPAELRLQMEKQ
jgi:hypothetical protein